MRVTWFISWDHGQREIFIHPQESFMDSTFSTLSCESEEFFKLYDSHYKTAILCEDAALTDRDREKLKTASGKKYHLDKLVDAMLEEAPTDAGKRYVAVVLHIARTKGVNTIIEMAQAWMDYLFLPMLTISTKDIRTEPSGGQTPTLNGTVAIIENATGAEQKNLRAAVFERERYRCAVTGTFDSNRAGDLRDQGKGHEILVSSEANLQAAHIIPYLLNEFNSAARTRELLQSWTGLSIAQLIGANINTPANAILMTPHDHNVFSRFRFYFDKGAFPDVPNKYKVRMSAPRFGLSNTQTSADVQFQPVEVSGYEPPNPAYLAVHAAFARVLHHSGAAEYSSRFEDDDERSVPLFMHPTNDFIMQLDYQLSILAN